jgi:hypothetical protein
LKNVPAPDRLIKATLVSPPLSYFTGRFVYHLGGKMLQRIKSLTVITGLVGAVIITLGSLITAFGYTDANGSYSPFNHFVSELGHTSESELSIVMNISFVLSGICFALHLIGVALRFDGWFKWVMLVGGAITGIFGSLVGIFPMNVNSDAHSTVAGIFFVVGMITVAFFSAYVLFANQTTFPKWIGYVGIPHTVFSLIFLITMLTSGANPLGAPTGPRDSFLLIAASEWGVIVALIVWVLFVSINLWSRRET